MSKPVILTGLRANNELHIGNYLGALLPLIDMAKKRAEEYQINLFVPDLHSFTTPIDHASLQSSIMQNIKAFVAAGLPLGDPEVYIYRQSYIPAHSELTWILDCFTGFGEMRRMTQFKERTAKFKEEVGFVGEAGSIVAEETVAGSTSVGVFNYPVLMAADILLYSALYIPVGDDQTQHLEYTRDIAERMNNRFKAELFIVPKPVKKQHEFFGKDQGLRIRDLQDPSKKMSKSEETGKGVIFLTDSPDTARKKIMSAETDSVGSVQYDYHKQPGISNLLDILKLMGGRPDEFIGQTQYGPLKTSVADKVGEFLADFQAKLAKVDEAAILSKLETSEQAMSDVASKKLYIVQKAVGLRP